MIKIYEEDCTGRGGPSPVFDYHHRDKEDEDD